MIKTSKKRLAAFALCTVIGFSGCSSLTTAITPVANASGSVEGQQPTPATTADIDSFDMAGFTASQSALALNRAELAEKQGKTREAIRYYEQAAALNPSLQHISRRLAVMYDQSGADSKARAAYEHAVQLQPNDADLMNDFGVFNLRREDWRTAEAWFQRCLALDAGHERALTNLGKSLAMQNRIGEAYNAFSQVSGPAAAYSNLGVLLARQGRTEEARKHFQQAVNIDGSIQPARRFLTELDASERPNAPTPGPNAAP